ncbi:MAG: DedA family protein [Candidatus Saccharimonadales bacterium]
MFDVTHIIQSGGLILIGLIIFAESGMMVGFFFPGDTLLLSAGVLAAAGTLSLPLSILIVAVAAILGDNTGYQIGKSFGPKLFTKKDSLIFRHDYIMKAEAFFDKYGSKTMLVAHFIPVIRSFAPVAAGAGSMKRQQFFMFDAIGDIAWSASIILFGYFVGSRIPGIDKYVEPLLILVVLVVLLPTIYHALKDPKIRESLKSKVRRSKKS